MGGRSASVLTKKQRTRIREGFAGMGEDKVRRDQQRIRERVRAGLLDFELLGEYPDRQLELAVDDLDDGELRRALADTILVAERIRILRGYDRDTLMVRTRERASDISASESDVATLHQLDLQTPAEIQRETEQSVRDQLGGNVWDRRSNGALKLAASAFVPLFGIWIADWLLAPAMLSTGGLAAILFLLLVAVLFLGIAVAFLIKAAQTLKHDLIPGLRALRRDPKAAIRGTVAWVRRPGQTLRNVWDEL